jgi:hypothetical protein
LEDHFLEALAGSLKGLNTRDLLPEEAAAIQALVLAKIQAQHATAEAPIVVADGSAAPAFVPQARTLAVGARYRPGMPGRYRNRAARSLDRGNLVLGQT